MGLVVSLALPSMALAQEGPSAEEAGDTTEAAPAGGPDRAEPGVDPTDTADPGAESTEAPASESTAASENTAAPPETPGSAVGTQLSAPTRTEPATLRLDLDDERPPGFEPAPARVTPPSDTRPRDWRYSRRRAQRPVTLPQGAMRMENSKSVSYLGRATMNFQFSVAAGLHDDLEIGAAPLGLSMSSFWPSPHDPEVYARVRVLSGPVQVALRSNVVFPLVSRNTQWGLTAELAWIAEDWLRLDTALDYQMLFDQPFQQRVGVPVALTLQGGINAVSLTTGFYVFNDFDDIDVPLLARYSVAFGGHQGPIAEIGIEGGFLDVIPNPDVAWTARATVTWFAFLGRP